MVVISLMLLLSPLPAVPTYVSIDDAYADSYFRKIGSKIDHSKVLPVLHALQGHPELGKLWESHINSSLFSPNSTSNAWHNCKRTIYSITFCDVKVLLICQVINFALSLSSPNEDIAIAIYDIIGKRLMLPGEDKPRLACMGLVDNYNGVQAKQSSDFVSINLG